MLPEGDGEEAESQRLWPRPMTLCGYSLLTSASQPNSAIPYTTAMRSICESLRMDYWNDRFFFSSTHACTFVKGSGSSAPESRLLLLRWNCSIGQRGRLQLTKWSSSILDLQELLQ